MVLAAIVMIGGFELLRNMEWLQIVFGQDFDPSQYRLLAFGLLMVAIMIAGAIAYRLLPQSAVLLVTVGIFSIVLFSPVRAIEVSGDIIAAAVASV